MHNKEETTHDDPNRLDHTHVSPEHFAIHCDLGNLALYKLIKSPEGGARLTSCAAFLHFASVA